LLISSEGVAPSWTVGVSTSVIFPCTIKIQKIMVAKSTIIGYHPWAPHTPTQTGGEETQPERSTAEAEGCIRDDLRADKLRKV